MALRLLQLCLLFKQFNQYNVSLKNGAEISNRYAETYLTILLKLSIVCLCYFINTSLPTWHFIYRLTILFFTQFRNFLFDATNIKCEHKTKEVKTCLLVSNSTAGWRGFCFTFHVQISFSKAKEKLLPRMYSQIKQFWINCVYSKRKKMHKQQKQIKKQTISPMISDNYNA